MTDTTAYERLLTRLRGHGLVVDDRGDHGSAQTPGHSPHDRGTTFRRTADGVLVWCHNEIIFGGEDEPGAAIDGFRRQLAAFSPTDEQQSGIVLQELIGEDNRVVARLRVVGRHTGYHPRMPEPTGRCCKLEQIWIFTLTGGYITEIRALSDRLGMFLQLGWEWPTIA